MKINVEILGTKETKTAFERLQKLSAQKAKEVVNTSAINIQREAKKRCPVDTGRLRSSIRMEFFEDGLAGQVGTDVQYAPAVEFGTAPHEIRPKKKKALYWPGADHPVKRVMHPGTKPHPFLFPAAEQERPKFIQAIMQALRELEAGK